MNESGRGALLLQGEVDWVLVHSTDRRTEVWMNLGDSLAYVFKFLLEL